MTIEGSFYRRVSCRNPAVAFSLHARQCHVEKMALPWWCPLNHDRSWDIYSSACAQHLESPAPSLSCKAVSLQKTKVLQPLSIPTPVGILIFLKPHQIVQRATCRRFIWTDHPQKYSKCLNGWVFLFYCSGASSFPCLSYYTGSCDSCYPPSFYPG